MSEKVRELSERKSISPANSTGNLVNRQFSPSILGTILSDSFFCQLILVTIMTAIRLDFMVRIMTTVLAGN